MEQKDTEQLLLVLTWLVEDGDTWRLMPQEIRDAAMTQFMRLQNDNQSQKPE